MIDWEFPNGSPSRPNAAWRMGTDAIISIFHHYMRFEVNVAFRDFPNMGVVHVYHSIDCLNGSAHIGQGQRPM